MKILNSLSLEESSKESRSILEGVKSKIGMVPNLYAAMGHSDKLLQGFLQFRASLEQGSFTAAEQEVIALATSEANGCNYCLAAHTALGKMVGFTEEDTINIRSKNIADQKLNALSSLVQELINQKGHPSAQTLDNFFKAGYSKNAFAELIGFTALTTITNYVYHNGGFEIDFPKAPQLITE